VLAVLKRTRAGSAPPPPDRRCRRERRITATESAPARQTDAQFAASDAADGDERAAPQPARHGHAFETDDGSGLALEWWRKPVRWRGSRAARRRRRNLVGVWVEIPSSARAAAAYAPAREKDHRRQCGVRRRPRARRCRHDLHDQAWNLPNQRGASARNGLRATTWRAVACTVQPRPASACASAARSCRRREARSTSRMGKAAAASLRRRGAASRGLGAAGTGRERRRARA